MEPYLLVLLAAVLAFFAWMVQRSIVSNREGRDAFISMQVQNSYDHKRTTDTLIGVTTCVNELGEDLVGVRIDVAHIKGRLDADA